jgi:hypothetical protein
MRILFTALLLSAAGLACCGGCGSSPSGPPAGATIPVKGKVTYRGKPLTRGTITFEPTDAGRDANGAIQSDGSFTLTTFKDGDGAIPGTHKVKVNNAGRQVRQRKVKRVEVVEETTDYPIEIE